MSNIKDVIDINNLSRSNLVELAKFMRLWNPPLLPRFFILKRISNQLQFLRDDDKVQSLFIQKINYFSPSI